jgi:hypothetical protein
MRNPSGYPALSTAVLPGKAGISHALAVAAGAMTQAMALAKQNASQTQAGMQKIIIATTAKMLALIAKG